ncbi:hypothetical protein [Acrocarpospora sp. B8E8]|uniref:hypothetical protein n=1 Tax=Acrocarpospora sp. B8E8 TaxID=3153572 RepID=UPI00325EE80C
MAEINIPAGPLNRPPYGTIRNVGNERSSDANAAALVETLAGLELGTEDVRILEWLARWEPSTVATICSWILRARALAPERPVPVDPDPLGYREALERAAGGPIKGCEIAGCTKYGWEFSASGTVYLCSEHRTQVEQGTAEILAKWRLRAGRPVPVVEERPMVDANRTATISTIPGELPGTIRHLVTYTVFGQTRGQRRLRPEVLEHWRELLAENGWTVVDAPAEEPVPVDPADEQPTDGGR